MNSLHECSSRTTVSRLGEPEGGGFEREVASLRGLLHRRACFMTQDGAAADDLVQMVMERALVARARFQSGTNLQAWLASILRNLFIDSCRQRRRAAHAESMYSEGPRSMLGDGPCDVLSPDDLLAAAQSLPPAERVAFELACVQGRSYLEISRQLGITVSTVGTRLFRARARLRRLLTVRYGEMTGEDG